jgi:hypothetical protein
MGDVTEKYQQRLFERFIAMARELVACLRSSGYTLGTGDRKDENCCLSTGSS